MPQPSTLFLAAAFALALLGPALGIRCWQCGQYSDGVGSITPCANRTAAKLNECPNNAKYCIKYVSELTVVRDCVPTCSEKVVNKFSDLTLEEFEETHVGLVVDPHRPPVVYEQVTHEKVPEEFDWRKQKAVTRVKDQGACSSCWAFSAIGAVEGAYAIKHKELKEFSEQQLVSCDLDSEHCEGGYMQEAIQYIKNAGGIEGESDYPYAARNGTCTFDANKVRAKVSKMLAYNLTNEADTKALLVKNGPIAVAIDSTNWNFYGSILWKCTSTKPLHGVLLVGYGKDEWWGARTFCCDTDECNAASPPLTAAFVPAVLLTVAFVR